MNKLSSTSAHSSLQEHYTDAPDIQNLMGALLGDVSGKTLLDPAVGHGALLKRLKGRPTQIDGVDVNVMSLHSAAQSLPDNFQPIHSDFLDLFVVCPLERRNKLLPSYDAIIANPPYGLKMSIEYRRAIKKAYPDVYARESYGLFLDFSLRILKPNGRYVFIVPDTFLHSVNHRPLRRAILLRGKPTHIFQFPSRHFETVNFGYANLCIIAGDAAKIQPSDKVIWIDGTTRSGSLADLLNDAGCLVAGKELLESADRGWVHPANRNRLHFVSSKTDLGSIAECRTGLYSGDNERFVGFDRSLARARGAGHPIDWSKSVVSRELSEHERENGIEAGPSYAPLIKGGHRKPFEETRWAIDWSIAAVNYYRSDKKARLQNSRFYFRAGLAVPMVTSGRISASLFSNSVFDQGVVGVFPKCSSMIPFLLIYLNSRFVSEMKRSLNASANNSANYLKRLPVPNVSDGVLMDAATLVGIAERCGWEATEVAREELVEQVTKRGMT